MLPQRDVPEAAPDLVPTLPDLHSHKLARHVPFSRPGGNQFFFLDRSEKMRERWLRRLLLISSLLGAALSIPARPYRGSRSGVRQAVHTGDSAGGEGRQQSMNGREKWLTQRIDHFSPDSRTFQQRYFINTTFYEAGGPIFLCVGGEGPPLDEAKILICTWTQDLCM